MRRQVKSDMAAKELMLQQYVANMPPGISGSHTTKAAPHKLFIQHTCVPWSSIKWPSDWMATRAQVFLILIWARKQFRSQ